MFFTLYNEFFMTLPAHPVEIVFTLDVSSSREPLVRAPVEPPSAYPVHGDRLGARGASKAHSLS